MTKTGLVIVFSWSYFKLTQVRDTSQFLGTSGLIEYSGDLYNELVRYLNGHKVSNSQIVIQIMA